MALWPFGELSQGVKTSPFHGAGAGSNPALSVVFYAKLHIFIKKASYAIE